MLNSTSDSPATSPSALDASERAEFNLKAFADGAAFHAGLAILLVVSAFVAMRLISLPPTNITVIWLPAGIALLALRSGRGWQCVPTIALSHWLIIAIANDYAILSFRPWSLLMVAANTLHPALAAIAWQRWVAGCPFVQPRGFLRFVFGVAILPAILTSWIIPLVIKSAGFLPGVTAVEFLTRVASITLSSALGVFLVVPIVSAPWFGGMARSRVHIIASHLANACTALFISIIGFHVTPTGLFLAIPFAFASAVACGARGLGIGLLLFFGYGLSVTAEGIGPFGAMRADPVLNLFELGTAVLCLGVPAYLAGLTLNRLQSHRTELEAIISARTRDLRASEERYRLGMNAVSEGVFDWNNGVATSRFNRAIRRKLGHVLRQRGTGWTPVWRAMHPEDRTLLKPIVQEFMFGAVESFNLESRLRTRSGEWCWFRARGQVIERDTKGRAHRIVGTFSDVNEEKQRSLDLTAQRDQADTRERAKDTFLANMSHEIRTPMHAMLGFARVLDSSPLDERQRECVDAILSSGDILMDLLNDLLDLSRIEAGAIELEPAPCLLDEIARGAARLFEAEVSRKKLRFSLNLDLTDQPYLKLDRLRVHQVMTNLLSNAVKFTAAGSVEMNVSARRRTDSANQWDIRIEVLDTGIGIAAAHIHRLFNPFAQADGSITRKFGGTGLGLAISKRLCGLMDGDITVTSTPGRGSVFIATLQATETDPPAPPQEEIERDDAHLANLSVLVVEDNRLNRRLAGMLLQKQGHRAEFAHNGAEAVDLLVNHQFDLILMDLQMPELDGFGATEKIRARERLLGAGRRTPIVALTANAGGEERTRCFEVGMDDYLTKPLNLKTFRSTLSRVLREAAARAET
ncbi:ATP-binding protein [Synoicihabitans lomoniglobus]|uniref:ATP-binding protein n=1 Tax=Synoicihabitans lomoniglobus TaxID=2909285 RepID=UPI002ED45A24|nr:ATP-binding protein [Opitutaceae bacterium LMO-M01]